MNCSICTFRYNKNRKPIGLICGHTFCSECIAQQKMQICPKCKGRESQSFVNKDLYQIVMNNDRHLHIDKFVKVCFFGESQVGKTCLLTRLAQDNFNYSTIPTIGLDFKYRQEMVNGKNIRFQLWDSAGQQRLRSVTPHHYRNSDIVLLVYDLTKTPQQNSLNYWLNEVQKYIQSSNVIVVGNKKDLIHEGQQFQPFKDSEMEEIKKRGWKVIQVSCKNGQNINILWKIMKQMTLKIRNSIQLEQNSKLIGQRILMEKSGIKSQKNSSRNSSQNSFWRCPSWCTIM